jgi:hypothetical protein
MVRWVRSQYGHNKHSITGILNDASAQIIPTGLVKGCTVNEEV